MPERGYFPFTSNLAFYEPVKISSNPHFPTELLEIKGSKTTQIYDSMNILYQMSLSPFHSATQQRYQTEYV